MLVRPDEQVLTDSHLVEELDGLPRARHPGPGSAFWRPVIDGHAGEGDRTGGGGGEAGHDVEDGGFARSVGAHEAEDLAGPHRKTHRINGDQTTEGDGEVLDLEAHGFPARSRRGRGNVDSTRLPTALPA